MNIFYVVSWFEGTKIKKRNFNVEQEALDFWDSLTGSDISRSSVDKIEVIRKGR